MRVKKVINEAVSADFVKACQANPTYKKALAIVKKYGYGLDNVCCVTSYGTIHFRVINDFHKMQPEIWYSTESFRGKDYKFRIQTVAHGALDLDEYTEFLNQCNQAFKMCKELSKLDLTTLHHEEKE